jgi:hypothetical protein
MCSWDPIGVMDDPDSPRDEYDCLVGGLLTMLQSRATDREFATYLRNEVVEHFGLSPGHYDFTAVAGRVLNWFDRAWRDLREPTTIFVALVGEGADVWRPVRARPLREPGLFRIVGVEADVRDETWQFPAGAIVRCERRQCADGEIQMTAVEGADEAG